MQEGLIIFVYQWIPSPATWSRHGFDMNGEVTHTVVEMNWVQSSPVCKQKQSWEIQEKERKGFEAEGNYALRCVCVGGGGAECGVSLWTPSNSLSVSQA